MRWVMDLFGRLRHREPQTPESLRFELKQTDPDFARVSQVHHDALGLIGSSRAARQLAQRVADGQALRTEREFWERHPRG